MKEKISKRKFIEGGYYLCGIGTGNGVNKYKVGRCKICDLIGGGKRTNFSFSNGCDSNTELPYKYPTGSNSYRVISAKLIK